MASRKRLYTKKTLSVIDTADNNIPKALGIIAMVKESIKIGSTDDLLKEYDNALWAAEGLLHDVLRACNELSKEEAIFVDTLEEFLEEERMEKSQ